MQRPMTLPKTTTFLYFLDRILLITVEIAGNRPNLELEMRSEFEITGCVLQFVTSAE